MNNVDPAELAKFDALAARWWDPDGEFRPLHEINPLRLGFIDERARVAGKHVLDIGCGGGILAEAMAALGANVTAIDLAPAPLAVARIHAATNNVDVTYTQISAEDFANERPHGFDVVTCLEMLEHVPDPASTVAACARLVKPGGHVFFSTINRNLKAYVFAIIGVEYMLRLLPRGTHEYAKFIRPSELDEATRTTTLTLESMIGMTYNPLTKRYRLAPDVSVNYLAHYLAQPSE
ncbi:MAG: bifunctional 2-polyprenyl-6-hydroxyphenol methylase/3-demethylubiquinol 3-O-methyltransferase UbiG [Gammaproteobacteria bacterium]|nr:bifunctional 2-polyprenyl-6-hydroxyphenol methylase/3-demethylubiquinol 3-O-methyltransferase UbiG [Gammaproteobacteria bacterium]